MSGNIQAQGKIPKLDFPRHSQIPQILLKKNKFYIAIFTSTSIVVRYSEKRKVLRRLEIYEISAVTVHFLEMWYCPIFLTVMEIHSTRVRMIWIMYEI